MELAGTGSSRANLTAEPAEAVDWCSKQSRAMGWALPFIGIKGGGARGRGEAARQKTGNRQTNQKQRSDTPPAPLCFDQHLGLEVYLSEGGRWRIPPGLEHSPTVTNTRLWCYRPPHTDAKGARSGAGGRMSNEKKK